MSSHYIKCSNPSGFWDNFSFYSASVISFPEYIIAQICGEHLLYETQKTQTEHSRIDRTAQPKVKTQPHSKHGVF